MASLPAAFLFLSSRIKFCNSSCSFILKASANPEEKKHRNMDDHKKKSFEKKKKDLINVHVFIKMYYIVILLLCKQVF